MLLKVMKLTHLKLIQKVVRVEKLFLSILQSELSTMKIVVMKSYRMILLMIQHMTTI